MVLAHVLSVVQELASAQAQVGVVCAWVQVPASVQALLSCCTLPKGCQQASGLDQAACFNIAGAKKNGSTPNQEFEATDVASVQGQSSCLLYICWYTEPESASPSLLSFGLYIDKGFIGSSTKLSEVSISLSCKIESYYGTKSQQITFRVFTKGRGSGR